MMFYDPDGNVISKDKFIYDYSQDYYLKELGDKGLVPGLRRCSEFVEKTINTILCEGIQSRQDVVRILAWKIGKIKHRASQNSGKCDDERYFKYSKDWENADKLGDVWLYCKKKDRNHENRFPIDKIASYIVNHKNKHENLEEIAKNSPQDFLNTINKYFKENKIGRMGTVYMITLLYFLSGGIYPIYDRFAMLALSAIYNEIKPESGKKVSIDVEFSELPTKDSNRFSAVMSCEMAKYIKMLDDIFGDSWKKNRDIDRALWVYGHLFEMK